jgi:hypothetical protein
VRLTIQGDKDRRLEVGPWSLDVVAYVVAVLFFGASLAAAHLRASTRSRERELSGTGPVEWDVLARIRRPLELIAERVDGTDD